MPYELIKAKQRRPGKYRRSDDNPHQNNYANIIRKNELSDRNGKIMAGMSGLQGGNILYDARCDDMRYIGLTF